MIDSKYRNLEPVELSPPDDRDYRIGAKVDIADDFPEEYAIWQPPVEDQGSVGNCVAQSIANIYETWEHREGKKHRDYSVGYIYGVTNKFGMNSREACAITVDEGNVYRDVWEALYENPECHELRMQVSDDIKATAKHMKEYIRLYSLPEIKAFLIKYNLPVLIVARGEDYSWMAAGGYHATACYGWDKDDNLLYTNSWGTGGCFGDGRGKIPFRRTILESWGILPMEKKSVEFTDIKGHWAEKSIKKFAEDGVVNGYADNTFKPNQPVTRAEVVAMLDRERTFDYEKISAMVAEKIAEKLAEIVRGTTV